MNLLFRNNFVLSNTENVIADIYQAWSACAFLSEQSPIRINVFSSTSNFCKWAQPPKLYTDWVSLFYDKSFEISHRYLPGSLRFEFKVTTSKLLALSCRGYLTRGVSKIFQRGWWVFQSQGTRQILLLFSPPVVGCLLKKSYKGVTGTLETAPYYAPADYFETPTQLP